VVGVHCMLSTESAPYSVADKVTGISKQVCSVSGRDMESQAMGGMAAHHNDKVAVFRNLIKPCYR